MTTSHENTDFEQEYHPSYAGENAPFGDANVRIDVDPDTYQRLHEAYLEAVEQGYSEGFTTFTYNGCLTNSYVTVDGEPVDPNWQEE